MSAPSSIRRWFPMNACRWLEIVFDRLVRLMTTSLRQLHQRQCRSQPGFHHLDPLRGLSGIPFRCLPSWRCFGRKSLIIMDFSRSISNLDLFHRGRASGRPARLFGHAYRRPFLHHHRAHPGAAHGGSHSPGHVRRPLNRWRRSVSDSIVWKPIPASPPLHGLPTPPSWSSCASTWKIAAGAPNCFCPMPLRWKGPIRKLLLQQFMGEKFWPRFHLGKAIWRRNCGPPRWISTPSLMNTSCRCTRS